MASGPSEFVESLVAVAHLVGTRLDARAQGLGLTLSRARRLGGEDGQTRTQLAHRLGIANSSVVALVDGLERAGLAERRAGIGDRRTRRVYLTAQAKDRAAELNGILSSTHADLLKNVPVQDLAAASAVLAQLLTNLRNNPADE